MGWARDQDILHHRAPGVSAWGVAEHIEHLLLADRAVLRWIEGSRELADPDGERDEPNEIGRAVLAAGSIPRGRGPAPAFALPAGMEASDLVRGLDDVRGRLRGLEDRLDILAERTATLPHHVLGHLSAAEWMRFLHIHHEHHAAIIRDILGATPAGRAGRPPR